MSLQAEWDRYNIDIPLTVIASPYREITRPILDYIRRIRRQSPRDVVTVFIPEYVVVHWWERLLHNQRGTANAGQVFRTSPQSLRVTPRRREKWGWVACRRRHFLGSCEPVGQPGAGARPRRVTHCCFEHADQNFGSP